MQLETPKPGNSKKSPGSEEGDGGSIQALLEPLRREAPPWAAIEKILDQGEAAKNALYTLVARFTEELSGRRSDKPDFDLENQLIHAIRILEYFDDERVIPCLFNIILGCENDFELLIVEVAHSALEGLARPDRFEVYWANYQRLFESPYSRELPDELQEFKLFILNHIAECGVPDPRLLTQLKEHFPKDPAFVAGTMAVTGELEFLPLLEAHLRRIAPIRKYIPFDRFFIPEHNEWVEVGSAWLYLKNKKEGRLSASDTPISKREANLRFFYDETESDTEIVPKKEADQAFLEVAVRDAELEENFLKDLPDQWTPEVIPGPHPVYATEADQKIADYLESFRPRRNAAKKIGRNEPCPCESGKKYKKCCGAQIEFP